LRETSTKPRLLALALVLAVATALATLAVFAAEARAQFDIMGLMQQFGAIPSPQQAEA
jgi:hypothetical protein